MSSTWMISWSNERPFCARRIGVPWHWNILLGTVCRSPLMCVFAVRSIITSWSCWVNCASCSQRFARPSRHVAIRTQRFAHCGLLDVSQFLVFFLVYCSWSDLYFPNMIRKGAISPREKKHLCFRCFLLSTINHHLGNMFSTTLSKSKWKNNDWRKLTKPLYIFIYIPFKGSVSPVLPRIRFLSGRICRFQVTL